MTNRQAAGDSDAGRDPTEDANAADEQEPGFVDTVASRAAGTDSAEPEETEPEQRHHPDNDGETVPE